MKRLSRIHEVTPVWLFASRRAEIPFMLARFLGLVLVCLLVSRGTGWGQVTTATFSGTVTDPTGAAVPDATVTMTQDETGIVNTKVTGRDGDFQFDFLRVGTYTINIEAKGFKRYAAKGIDLSAGQSVRQTYPLQVGDVTESVIVEASAPLVNTVSAEQSNSFDSKAVKDLPLARRNFSGLLRVDSGVTVATGGSATGLRLNGQGKNGTAYSVDGTESSGNPEGRNAGNFGAVNFVDLLSIESIEEVHIVKGILPAEYGGALGGQVDIVTRSGTNQIHGSVFENFQKETLNSRDPFLAAKVPFTYNQFGGSIGGPVKKNKIFLFGAYEGYRYNLQKRVEITVPTQATRTQVLAAQPVYASTFALVPLPNQPLSSPTATTGLYDQIAPAINRDNHFDVKGDIRLTDNSNLSLTYTHARPFGQTPSGYIGNDNLQYAYTDRGTASYVIGGATWTSETRLGYNNNDAHTFDQAFETILGGSEKFNAGNRLGRLTTNLGWNTQNSMQDLIISGPATIFGEKFSWHLGKHSLKFGGVYTHHTNERNNPEGVAYGYQGLSDLLNNIPTTVNASFGNGDNTAHLWELGLFIQDDWHVSSKLTLNLGLRYEYDAHMTAEAFNNSGAGLYNPDGLLNSTTFAVGPFRPQNNPYNSDPVNFGPRFGFAYDIDGGKTVIRGGTGIIFSPQIIGNVINLVGTQYIPKRIIFTKAEASSLGMKYPMTNDDLRVLAQQQAIAQGYTNIFAMINPNLQSPYTHHYTLGLQRELTKDLVLETSMVGVRGTKLDLWRPLNEPIRSTGIRPNPLLRATYYLDNSATSSYASWQTSLRKRYSHGLSASVHYTWGKALAYNGGDIGTWYQGDNTPRVQDFNNIRAEHAPATGDITHSFVSQAVYDLPRLANFNPFVHHVLGGWQLGGIFEARSGEPLSITQQGGVQVARPDYIGGNAINSNYRDTLQYLNPNAFARVPLSSAGLTVRPGNLGWGEVRAPGYVNVDFSLTKDIPIRERIHLQVRAETFNAFNHFNPKASGIQTSINNSTFGQIRDDVGPRVIQLNGRLTW
jgi:outer membrane receptor protein involved in Fe transport